MRVCKKPIFVSIPRVLFLPEGKISTCRKAAAFLTEYWNLVLFRTIWTWPFLLNIKPKVFSKIGKSRWITQELSCNIATLDRISCFFPLSHTDSYIRGYSSSIILFKYICRCIYIWIKASSWLLLLGFRVFLLWSV